MKSLRILVACFGIVVATTAVAGERIVVDGAAIRVAPAGGTTAGYLRLTNTGPEADRLVAVRSDIAGAIHMHEMTVTDGVMEMSALPGGIPLPVGEEVVLAPRGLHLMLMGTAQELAAGDTVLVTLEFATADAVEATFTVMSLGDILAAQ